MRDLIAYSGLIATIFGEKKAEGLKPINQADAEFIDQQIMASNGFAANYSGEDSLQIMKLFFNLEGEKQTLRQIGKIFNVSDSLVGERKRKILIKLRKNKKLLRHLSCEPAMPLHEVLTLPINNIGLSYACMSKLKKLDIKTVRDLAKRTEASLTPTLTLKNLNEIKNILGGYDLELGITFED